MSRTLRPFRNRDSCRYAGGSLRGLLGSSNVCTNGRACVKWSAVRHNIRWHKFSLGKTLFPIHVSRKVCETCLAPLIPNLSFTHHLLSALYKTHYFDSLCFNKLQVDRGHNRRFIVPPFLFSFYFSFFSVFCVSFSFVLLLWFFNYSSRYL